MESTEQDLHKHDDWAIEAVAAVHGMTAWQQDHLLRHIFRVVAYHETSQDPAAADALCHDLYSTITLHAADEYRTAVHDPPPPSRDRPVSIDQALETLAARR